MRFSAFPSLLFTRTAEMVQFIAKIRLVSDIVAIFYKGGNKESDATGQIPLGQVEEIRERLLTIVEDAYVITIGREDEDQERSVDEIVQEKQQLTEIPLGQVEEIRERLVTIAEDACVITIGREDEGQEKSADEIVQEKQQINEIPLGQVEEIRERLVTIAEDACVITIGRDDEGMEKSADEIVQEKQQLNEIPLGQVEEIRERLVRIAEDACVITIGRDDKGLEKSADEIVQEKQQLNEILLGQFEEIRERLVMIAEDACVITIGRDDEGQEKSADEIVEEKPQLNEIIPAAHIIVPLQEQFNLGGTSETLQLVNDVEVHQETSGKTPVSDTSTWVDVVLQTPSPLPKETCRWIKHYCSSHKILLVGEGDFSFSACLAKAFGSSANMVATSLNSLEFLQENYAKAMFNINYLKNRGCTVRHNFDATAMYNNRHLLNYDSGFDRIIYNFPLAGFFPGLSYERQLRRNRHLVRTFMANARKMLQPDGEIHITHKSNGFFLGWDLEDMATKSGLRLLAYVKFNLKDYPGYHTKYGFGGDKDFNCKPSRTYKFGLQ